MLCLPALALCCAVCRAALCCAVPCCDRIHRCCIVTKHTSAANVCHSVCFHNADGTLAERVTLGKRRREQLGIQSASDIQSSSGPSTSPRQSDETLPFSYGAPDKAATGPLTRAPGGRGPSGRAVGPAEGMMAKWGYTPGQISVTLCRCVVEKVLVSCFFRCILPHGWACVLFLGSTFPCS